MNCGKTSRHCSWERDSFSGTRRLVEIIVILLIFGLLSVMVFLHLKSSRMDEDITKLKSRTLSKRSLANETQGFVAVQLRGAIPIQHIHEDGKIGPWTQDLKTEVNLVALKEGGTEAEVKRSGLFFVYAQIYYITSAESNGFEILTYREGEEREAHRMAATCSCEGLARGGQAPEVHEVTCYTGTMIALEAGDRVYLNQIEQNRIINLNRGYSYFGIFRLS